MEHPQELFFKCFQVTANVKPWLRITSLKGEKAAARWKLYQNDPVKIGDIYVEVGGGWGSGQGVDEKKDF